MNWNAHLWFSLDEKKIVTKSKFKENVGCNLNGDDISQNFRGKQKIFYFEWSKNGRVKAWGGII